MSDSLLNKTQVRDFTFSALKSRRPSLAVKMTRIGEEYYLKIEARLRAKIVNEGQAADGGDLKTLRPKEPVARPAELEWLINQSNVRDYALKVMNGTTLTQIAGDYADACDLYLRKVIESYLDSMPSVGKTIN